MKGSECRLIEYMEGAKKRFIIPVYQRNYDWKTENCKQLFDDLVKVINKSRKSHFFGSIVSVYNPSGQNTEFLIIDGQQRLTTISLLMLAMYNLLSKGIVNSKDETLKEQLKDFLLDRYKPQESHMKLKPVKNDKNAFGKLFEKDEEYVIGSNITTNYNFFYDRIQKQEITTDQLFDAICRLEIINITLNNEDDPQLIFESLNSTGLDLSEGDKIRNFILMGLPSKEQNEYYEKYWNRIEEYTKYDVSAFVRDYLSIKQGSIPSQKRIYIAFKNYVDEKEPLNTEDMLRELLIYAKRYNYLICGNTGNKVLDACIYRLNRLETTVTRPFFLEVLRLYDNKVINIDDVKDIFLTTENYLFRRTICDLPTNTLNKTFLLLHREIERYDGTEENYVNKFRYALISKRDRTRFPNDKEFSAAFTERQIYLMNSKNKIYIMERLENADTKEDKDIYRHCDEGTYSIEHIMPQHLTPVWIRELGDDYEQIHEIWLHRIANLTLTAYNSKYSNSSFIEKKTMKNGFTESGIRMNTYIAGKDNWTIAELEERSRYLAEKAVKIWEYPLTDYKPEEKQLDSYTLDDDTDMSGKSIAKFSYKNTEQPVTSWVEMYQKVLQILYAEDKNIITKLAISNDDVNLSYHFSTESDKFNKSVEIGDGIFVWTNTNTQSKLSVLNRIFKLYDIAPSDLVFYLRTEGYEEEAGSRYELRRKYWAYAIDAIKDANKDNGCFSNAGVSKENWISGYFGINGFMICCVANIDMARVEICFGKPDKHENKKIFDALMTHKSEIETELGVQLTWYQKEDIKSCKIYHKLDNVSINNEVDWKQMAKFHAEWSRKFYDVFVPYLNGLKEL